MASFSFAIIAIFLNSQFGIFLLASIVAATILYSWLNGRRFSLEMMISGLFAVGGTLLYFTLQEHNPAAVYLLLGFGSLPVRKAVLANMLLINAAIYLCMLLFGKIKDALYYTLWLAVFYCQALLIYYIYYPMAHHIFSLATPFILLILMMIYVGMRRFKLVSLEKPLLTMGILTAFVFAYVPMAFSFYHDYNIYQANFKDHRLYQWRFPSAQFLSTMDPSMFEQAVKLIRQYNPSDRLYMISRYDTLLPALAGKYSAMRYPDLISNLVTKNEVTDLASLILQNKPKYLFIDSDLNRSFNNEVYNPNDPVTVYFEMYNNSIIHAKALRQLGLLFAEIANDYQPVARSPLITVYQRKDL